MANTTNFGWETPDDTDLVKDGALAMRTLGNAIDTSLVDLKGGTTGQVLSKNTNTDMDFVWTTPQTGDITEVTAGTGLSGGGTSGAVTLTNTVATTFDAKGDLVVGTGADTFAKLTVGTNGHTLVADSSTTTGLKWAAPAGGKVLQVVSATTTTLTTINTTTQTDTGITATITPTLNTSKILVLISACVYQTRSDAGNFIGARVLRDATTIANWGNENFVAARANGATGITTIDQASIVYLDSPASTSALTYKLQAKVETATNGATAKFQEGSSPSTITLLEIGA